MLTQNKKVIIYAAIALVIVLIMFALIWFMVQFLGEKLKQALAYEASASPIQGFNFELLKALNIKEINDLLAPTSTPTSTEELSTSTIPTSTSPTSTKATSTPATSTTSTIQ